MPWRSRRGRGENMKKGTVPFSLTPRYPEDHKGVFGHALIVAGSRGMMGAALLAAKACLKSGVGLVSLGIPKSFEVAAVSFIPEALTVGLDETSSGAISKRAFKQIERAHQMRRFDVLAVGPGISQSSETGKCLRLILEMDIPSVIDADALNLMAKNPQEFTKIMKRRKSPSILTPHAGEMARCLGISLSKALSERSWCAHHLAEKFNAVVIFKGHPSLIVGNGKEAVNSSGNTGLSRGGSGDILTGLVSGLWAQNLSSRRLKNVGAFETAVLGAYLHGLAGDFAEEALTPYAMSAQDLISFFPQAFKKICRK